MLAKALDSLPTSSRFWTLNSLSPIFVRIVRGDRSRGLGDLITLYLKYDIFVFEIVFTVATRHEWNAVVMGFGWGGQDATSLWRLKV